MNTNQTQEQANVLRQQAETISVLTHLGFDKAAATKAVTAGDLSKLTD